MIEALIFAAVSTLLYHLGLGLAFFLVPVQAVLVRKGKRAFLLALGTAFILIMAVRLITLGKALSGAAAFLIIELSAVVALMGGLVLIQLPELAGNPRPANTNRVLRLAIATALTGLAAIPVILYAGSSAALREGLRGLFSALASALNRTFSQSGALGFLPGETPFKAEELERMTRDFFLRSFLLDYFILLTFSWWAGTLAGSRSIGVPAGITRLADFHLAEWYIWPLIGSLAMVLLGLMVRTGALGIAAWNVLLIMLFVYGLSGLGIIKHLMRKYRLPSAARVLITLTMGILVLTPRANLAILVLIPGLGVSETWIKYRKEGGSEA